MQADHVGGLFWSPENMLHIFAHFPTFENERIKTADDQAERIVAKDQARPSFVA